tara:strand:- start:5232 stop:6593 length:1362 start_codon:yes stop_codon:yes gene_type:complete
MVSGDFATTLFNLLGRTLDNKNKVKTPVVPSTMPTNSMFNNNLTPSQRSQLYEQETRGGMGASINPYSYDKDNVYFTTMQAPIDQPMFSALENPNNPLTQTLMGMVNTDSAFPYEVENRDARVGEGFTYGTGMGPSRISDPSNYDLTSFYESPPNYDLTSFYESPVANNSNSTANESGALAAYPEGTDPNRVGVFNEKEALADLANRGGYFGPYNTAQPNQPNAPTGEQNNLTPQTSSNLFSGFSMPNFTSMFSPEYNRDPANMYQASNNTLVDYSPRSMAVGMMKGGPTASAYDVISDPDISTGGKIGAGALALGSALVPSVGPLSMLGAILNGMGAYHDVGIGNNLTGDMTLTPSGTLFGDMDAAGGSFYQTGGLNNYNTLASAPRNTGVNTGFGNFTAGQLTDASSQGMDANQAAYVAAMAQAIEDGGMGYDDSGGFSEGTSYGDEDSYG